MKIIIQTVTEFIGRLLPVATIVSPGARIAPGGRMKQLFGSVV